MCSPAKVTLGETESKDKENLQRRDKGEENKNEGHRDHH